MSEESVLVHIRLRYFTRSAGNRALIGLAGTCVSGLTLLAMSREPIFLWMLENTGFEAMCATSFVIGMLGIVSALTTFHAITTGRNLFVPREMLDSELLRLNGESGAQQMFMIDDEVH